jgi:hypothetical protein
VIRKVLLILVPILLTSGCRNPSRRYYPIGLYTVSREEAFLDAGAAGFNTVVTYDRDPQAVVRAERLAAATGLMLVVHPGRSLAVDGSFDPEGVDAALAELARSNTILAWYLFDEPEVYRLREDHLHNFHLYVSGRSPYIPTAFVVGNGEKYRQYAGCSDIAMLDWYPIPLHPLESISHHIRACRPYLGRTQPLWMVIQAFDWTPFSVRVREEGTGRVPTADELRFMAFLAAVEDVDGLFFWSYMTGNGKWDIREHPGLWRDLTSVVQELNAWCGFLVSRKVLGGTDVTDRDATPNGAVRCLLKKVSRGDIRKARKITGDENSLRMKPGRYLLALNASAEETVAELRFRRLRTGAVKDVLRGHTMQVEKGVFREELPPYGVRLYYLGI